MTPELRASTVAQMEIDGLILLAAQNGGRASMKRLPDGSVEYRLGVDSKSLAILETHVFEQTPWFTNQIETSIVKAACEYEARIENNPNNVSLVAMSDLEPSLADLVQVITVGTPRELVEGVSASITTL